MMKEDKKRRQRVEQAQREANEHNARIIPDTPGHVRIDGPRRQSKCTVDEDGRKTYTEI